MTDLLYALLILVIALFGLPFLIYLYVKLGVYAWLQGRRDFFDNQKQESKDGKE